MPFQQHIPVFIGAGKSYGYHFVPEPARMFLPVFIGATVPTEKRFFILQRIFEFWYHYTDLPGYLHLSAVIEQHE